MRCQGDNSSLLPDGLVVAAPSWAKLWVISGKTDIKQSKGDFFYSVLCFIGPSLCSGADGLARAGGTSAGSAGPGPARPCAQAPCAAGAEAAAGPCWRPRGAV